VVIVDDLTRPTPADIVLPHVLRQFEEAGIERRRVTIVVASGSHGPPDATQLAKKVGNDILGDCRVVAHDHTRNLVRTGRTSIGTPILVNADVARSDLVVGIGGVYPQHSTGFGGGSKLVMGVLGEKSIVALHYRHRGMEGSYQVDNSFRRDLDEIAMQIEMRTAVSIHVDERRRLVRIVSGDHLRYFADAAAFSLGAYAAPPPTGADVVIANAYPMDVSLTFAHSKGIGPLLLGRSAATRVMLAACSEGVGHHAVFPIADRPWVQAPRALVRTARWRPGEVPRKVGRRLRTAVRSLSSPAGDREPHEGTADRPIGGRPIWLVGPARALPEGIRGIHPLVSWEEGVCHMVEEQGKDRPLSAAVYSCAPLQTIASVGGIDVSDD